MVLQFPSTGSNVSRKTVESEGVPVVVVMGVEVVVVTSTSGRLDAVVDPDVVVDPIAPTRAAGVVLDVVCGFSDDPEDQGPAKPNHANPATSADASVL